MPTPWSFARCSASNLAVAVEACRNGYAGYLAGVMWSVLSIALDGAWWGFALLVLVCGTVAALWSARPWARASARRKHDRWRLGFERKIRAAVETDGLAEAAARAPLWSPDREKVRELTKGLR